MTKQEKMQQERIRKRNAAKRRRRRQVRMQRFGIAVLLMSAGVGLLVQRGHVTTQISEQKGEREVFSHAEDYPETLINLLERNPETADFVKGYPNEHDKSHKISLHREVKKGKIPLFLQWDKRWGYEQYGSDMIAITGCGPTCLSMVVCGITGDTKWSPLKVAQFAEENGYYEAGSGSKWILMSEGASALGIRSKELPLDEHRVKLELEQGNPIICIMGPGDFTTSGHYIVLTGLGKDDRIKVNDPNSKIRSEKEWIFEDIQSQMKNLWVFYA